MKKNLILIALVMFLLLGCSNTDTSKKDLWGSFTPEPTYSYDDKFIASQTVELVKYNESIQVHQVRVNILDADTKEQVYTFTPARARDFWGICWENDSYNLWTQSGDDGIFCYRYEDGTWIRDTSMERPDYIISKYDKPQT